MHSSSKNETIEARLDAMPMEDFEVLLKQASCPTKQVPADQERPGHAEILKQLKGTVDGPQDGATLSNSKYHSYSSLQSLNNNDSSAQPTPPHHHHHQNSHPATVHPPELKGGGGHHYGHHHYQLNHHTSTLTTINSTSSLNSIGVDGGGGEQPTSTTQSLHHVNHKIPIAYIFNDRDNDYPTVSDGSQYLNRSRGRYIPAAEPPIPANDWKPGSTSSTSTVLSGSGSGIGSFSGTTQSMSDRGCLSPDTSRSLTPNLPSHPGISVNRTPSEGSNDKDKRRLSSNKKKSNKTNVREVVWKASELHGNRGGDTLEDLVHFVEGNDSTAQNKKGKGKKEKGGGGGGKGKDTLVKSASLDENHLNTGIRKRSSSSGSSTERPSSNSLHEKSERAASSHQISSLPSQQRDGMPRSQKEDSPIKPDVNSNVPSSSSTTLQVADDTLEIRGLSNADAITDGDKPMDAPVVATVSSKDESQFINRDGSGDRERPFEVVTKKKRSRKSTTQREAETFSRGQVKEQARREQHHRSRRTGSAPGTDNSDQSDDDSVRSLPAGECTPKEKIPKQCASSGGTPQTSYADIAKVPEPKKLIPDQTSNVASTNGNNNNIPSTQGDNLNSVSTSSLKTAGSKKPPGVACNAASKPIDAAETPQKDKTLDRKDCASTNRLDDASTAKLKNNILNNKAASAPPPNTILSSSNTPLTNKGAKNVQHHSQQYVNRNRNQNQINQRNNCNSNRESSQLERPYLTTVIGTTEAPASNQNKEEMKVLIEDITEFPEISASLTAPLTNRPPFSKRTAHNSPNALQTINNNVNNNNNVKKGSVEHVNTSCNDEDTLVNKEKTRSRENVIPLVSEAPQLKAVEPVVRVVRPVFVQPNNNCKEDSETQDDPTASSQDLSSTAPTPAQQNLVNGDCEQNKTDVAENEEPPGGGPNTRTNLATSSVGDVPVIFWGGKFESELPPNQNVGVEFGFNVMENMTHLQTWREVPDSHSTPTPSNVSSVGCESNEKEEENSVTSEPPSEELNSPPPVDKPSVPSSQASSWTPAHAPFQNRERGGVQTGRRSRDMSDSMSGNYRTVQQGYQSQDQGNRRSTHPQFGGGQSQRLMYPHPRQGQPQGTFRERERGRVHSGGNNSIALSHQQPPYQTPIPLQPPLTTGAPPQTAHHFSSPLPQPPHGPIMPNPYMAMAQGGTIYPDRCGRPYDMNAPMVAMPVFGYPQPHMPPLTSPISSNEESSPQSVPGNNNRVLLHWNAATGVVGQFLLEQVPDPSVSNIVNPHTRPGPPSVEAPQQLVPCPVPYGEGGVVMVAPSGLFNPSLYYDPPGYHVPNPAAEVDRWMNGHIERTYQMEAQGKLTVHRI